MRCPHCGNEQLRATSATTGCCAMERYLWGVAHPEPAMLIQRIYELEQQLTEVHTLAEKRKRAMQQVAVYPQFVYTDEWREALDDQSRQSK